MTIDEYRSLKPKRSKFGNIKTGGNASRKEHSRAVELRLMERAGVISDLKEQQAFEIIPAQYKDGKCVERACKYIADFTYVRDGVFIVEDSKPERKKGQPDFRTDVYKIKRKLMLKIWGIAILET